MHRIRLRHEARYMIVCQTYNEAPVAYSGKIYTRKAVLETIKKQQKICNKAAQRRADPDKPMKLGFILVYTPTLQYFEEMKNELSKTE